jgi:hypothetical protein
MQSTIRVRSTNLQRSFSSRKLNSCRRRNFLLNVRNIVHTYHPEVVQPKNELVRKADRTVDDATFVTKNYNIENTVQKG